jgi:hypothetical protein
MFARTCLDWTEHRHHVAGALGAALMTCFFEYGWLTRIPNQRALRGFAREFGINVQKLQAAIDDRQRQMDAG